MKTKFNLSMFITFLFAMVMTQLAEAKQRGALFVSGADLDALTTDFVNFGGKIFQQNVNAWEIDPFITIYPGLNKPLALPKIKAVGGPRPYRAQDDLDNGVAFSDRVLAAYQSKWDYDIDPEVFRNKYLATKDEVPFYQFILDSVTKKYLSDINDLVLLDGVYDPGGDAPEDIADGFSTIIQTAILDGDLAEIATGAITAANAVTKIEQVADALPAWMKGRAVTIFCSYTVFQYYRTHYRATYGFSFNKRESGEFMLDTYVNVRLKPVSWMGNSLGVIATVSDNLSIGTDGNQVQIAATKRRNIIEIRQMMPIGLQIADLDALFVNDQFTP